jgi:plasmid stability protein
MAREAPKRGLSLSPDHQEPNANCFTTTRRASMLATAFEGTCIVATLVIRNVDDAIHIRLKALAASHGRSMEEEARLILRDRLATAPASPPPNWVDAVRALFEPLGGLDLPQISREPPHEPPDFSGPEWDRPA